MADPQTIWFANHVRAVSILQGLALFLVIVAIVTPIAAGFSIGFTIAPIAFTGAGIVYALSHIITLLILQIEATRVRTSS